MATNKQIIEFQGKGIAKLKTQYAELEKRTRSLEGATNKGSKSLGGMVAALGLTTGALYGTMRAFSGVISVGRNFEKQISNLSAITGATGEELKALEQNARQLGSTTVFTASEVAQLSVEFGKLGFTSKEIQGVTKDTLALAAASGTELGQAAMIAGQTLRAFGLDVSETSRVTDTMAASFSRSALDMEKFSFSMQYVAPIAKQVGLDVESTTAMLGTLANAGIDGSMAGTALRKIFLELGNETSKLGKKIGFPVKSTADLEKAFKQLREQGLDTAAMKELVGQRAVSAFSILLDGVDDTNQLTEGLKNAGGAAQEMAETQLDNLDGSLTLLNSAMEGLGLRMFEFVGGPLRNMVDGLTELTTEIDEDSIRSFGAYAVGITGVVVAVKAYSAAVLLAKKRTELLTIAMAKNPAGLIAVSVGLLAGTILDLTGALDPAEDATEDLNDDLSDTDTKAKNAQKSVKGLTKSLEAFTHEFDLLSKMDDEQFEAFMDRDEPVWLDGTVMSMEAFNERLKEQKSILKDPEFVEVPQIIQRSLTEAVRAQVLGMEDTISQYSEITDGIMNLSDQYTAFEMQNIDNRRQKEIDAAMASGLNEEAKQAKIQNIKEKYAKQERDLQKKQKAPMIAQAIANTALGVTKALGQEGVLGIISGALIAAAGAVEVATIQAQEFATGGQFVTNGPEMIKVGDNPSGRELVEITPLGGDPNINGPQGRGVTLNISAPLVDETVVDAIIPALEKANRMNLA